MFSLQTSLRAIPGLAAKVALIALLSTAAKADPVISVVNLDVLASQQDAAVAALRTYRGATRTEPGNGEVLLLQERPFGNRFVVYERWNSAEALAAHEKASANTELRQAWRVLEGSPFDRRQFVPVFHSAGTAAPAASAVYLKVYLDVLPRGLDTTLGALPALETGTQSLAGNLRLDISQHAIRPTSHFTILTSWNAPGGIDEFERSDAARQFRKAIGPWIGSPYDDRVYAAIGD